MRFCLKITAQTAKQFDIWILTETSTNCFQHNVNVDKYQSAFVPKRLL